MRFDTIVITGANRGLGHALATYAYYHIGCRHLILHSRKKQNNNFVKLPGIKTVTGDLREYDTKFKIKREVEDGVSILINNAGIRVPVTLDELKENDVTVPFDINVGSPILLIKELWDALKKGKGVVLNINSLSSKVPGADEIIYGATKAALTAFSDAMQYKCTESNVRMINVLLGAMKTDMTEARKDWDKLIEPSEVAQLLFSLCHNYQTLRIPVIEIMRKNY